MRIWDLAPEVLCRQHLLGEHRELHAIWSILTGDRPGYRNHPETLRWEGRLTALYDRHQRLVREMEARGYRHRSALDRSLATGEETQPVLLDSKEEQRRILEARPCPCPLDRGDVGSGSDSDDAADR